MALPSVNVPPPLALRHNTSPFPTPSRPSSSPAPPPAPPSTNQQYKHHPSIHLHPSGSGGSGDILQQHLTACFEEGVCSDVRVRVERWSRVYRLHKVVLIQSGFFDSCFKGGFAESEDDAQSGPVLTERSGSWEQTGEREINLRMEDPNISRAAFELLIARLYSTGPPLHLAPEAHPTPFAPLSPSFPYLANTTPPLDGHQPASPRFLLSILATSIYLGMPGVTQSVLSLVLGNISPWSIGAYLDFAIGRGVGAFAGEEWEDHELETGVAAVGLEELGELISPLSIAPVKKVGEVRMKSRREGIKTGSPTPTPSPSLHSSQFPPASFSRSASPTPSIKSETSSNSSLDSNLIHSIRSSGADEPTFFYGSTSDKIGEACAVWLCKWGVDILDVEERTRAPGLQGVEERFGSLGIGKKNALHLSADDRKAPVGDETTSSSTLFPPLFSLGGLPPAWIRAVVSSDSFFVKGEVERYKVARRIHELRRAQRDAARSEAGGRWREDEVEEQDDEEADEEEEFELLFAGGIHYTHMSFEELAFISQDLSPASGMPFAPLSVLQTSLWYAQELRTKILASSKTNLPLSPGSVSSSSSAETNEELGIAVSAETITKRIEKAAQKEVRRQRRRSRSLTRSSATSLGLGSPPSAGPGSRRQLSELAMPATPSTPSAAATASASSIGAGLGSLESRTYWPVPTDDTFRLGAWGGFVDLSNPGGPISTLSSAVADLGPRSSVDMSTLAARGAAESEETFFGIGPSSLCGAEIANEVDGAEREDRERMFTGYQPFRWGVEFFNVDRLKEKQREYSSTIFYAGSYWNCYVQQIRKKDRTQQIGVYLHRNSASEPIPTPSAPPPRKFPSASSPFEPASPLFGPLGSLFEPASFGSTATSSSFLGTSPTVPASHHSPSAPPPATLMPTTTTSNPIRGPVEAFRDPRKVVKLFFCITCHSSLGTALTCFSSAPDVFTVSQSWGWKSSSLRSEEYLSPAEGHVLPEEDTLIWSGGLDDDRLRCLRATVVLGLI